MKLRANLKSMRINKTKRAEVDLLITLEAVSVSTLGLILDLETGPVFLEILPAGEQLRLPIEKAQDRVPEAFR